MVAGGADGNCVILDLAEGKMSSLKLHDGAVNGLSWAPAGGPEARFVSGGSDGAIKVWTYDDNKIALKEEIRSKSM